MKTDGKGFRASIDKENNWPGGLYCIQEIDLAYLTKFEINVEEYTGLKEDDIPVG